MKEKLRKTIGVIGIPIFLVIGTLCIYLFAKGYRFNISDRTLEQTGVISVKTFPRRASIFIDEESAGQSPRTVGGISVGSHTVEIYRDGYFDWSMNVDISAEQLIPLEVVLFMKDSTKTTVFSNDETVSPDPDTQTTISHFYADNENTAVIFSVLSDTSTVASSQDRTLDIWIYPAKRRFWEINVEPQKIAEFTDDGIDLSEPDPIESILLSPNGQRVLLRVLTDSQAGYYILDTGEFNDQPVEFSALTDFKDISPTWSLDSTHIIYSKNNELRSVNTDTSTQSVISEKTEDESFIWTSNSAGHIFLFESEEDFSKIVRVNPDGSNPTTIIELPTKSGSRTLSGEDQAAEDDNNDETVQTEEPAQPQIAATIEDGPIHKTTDMMLTPAENQIVLFGPDNIIVYTLDEENVDVYQADNPEFLSFSPDKERFLYFESGRSCLGEFRFLVEEGDPFHQPGPKQLIETATMDEIEHITWHPQSHNILYTTPGPKDDDRQTYIITALDTENLQRVNLSATLTSSPIAIDSTGKFLIAKCSEKEICSIDLYE